MKKVNNKCIFMLGMILGLVISVSSVYAVEAYIESNKVSYDNSKSKGSYKEVQSSIDELYEISGIHKEKWIDPILNGADPVLKDPLIPVEIKPNGDVYYANLNSEWYNYSEKRWANAVILTDTAGEYSVGQHILEKDIESYFVWIPRYQYRIWNLANTEEYTKAIDTSTLTNKNYSTSPIHIVSNARIIDIKFGDVNATPKMSESDAKLNEYYTHPAFTLGDKDLNGIWVGKFETGYKNAKDSNSARVNKEESASIIIKPNVYAWRGINIKNIFLTSYNYKKNLNSHMIKNTEWGAVAYLSHSAYGKGNEINVNNASDYMTGYSSTQLSIQESIEKTYGPSSDSQKTQPWNTEIGYLASTTGNITGVYDISGGTSEYVAAYRKGSTDADKSGFNAQEITQQISAGYIDGYSENSSVNSYNNRILGDATGELGPFYRYYDADGGNRYHNSWYVNEATFLSDTSPWFRRGGGWNKTFLAGPFYFSWVIGNDDLNYTFRIALSPNS